MFKFSGYMLHILLLWCFGSFFLTVASAQTTHWVPLTSQKSVMKPTQSVYQKVQLKQRKRRIQRTRLPVVQRRSALQGKAVQGKASVRRSTARPKVPTERPLPRRIKPMLPKASRGWWHNSYLADWGVVLAVAGGGVAVNFIEPPKRPFRKDDPSISLPLREDFISEPLLVGLAAGIPMATFALAQIGLRSGHNFHHAALGLAETLSLTFLVTNIFKVTVGRLRPDFLERCQPDANNVCTGEASVVRKGRRSFPSGHSSFAMAGGVYLSLYLWGTLRRFEGPGSFWRIPVILAPIAGASLILVSRIVDNRHHAEDVLFGALLGAGFAVLGYHLNFPAPWSKNAGTPYQRSRISVLPTVTPKRIGLAVSGQF